MGVIYNTDVATGDNQIAEIALLTQIKDAVNLLSGTTEPQEIAILNSILAALVGASTATNQVTANTSLASILANMATSAKQDTSNTALSAILSGMATSVLQNTINTSINAMSAKLTGGTGGVISSLNRTASSQTVLPSNAARKGLYLYNDSGSKCYLSFAATSSASAFSLILSPNSGYESPQAKVYTGPISVIWDATGTGALRITEIS